MGWGQKGHIPPDPPAPNRFWKAPNGALYRVVLEPAARHLRMHGETRGTISFILLSDRPRTVRVADGTDLGQLTDAELVELLASAR
jgi:hypothetical protein